MESIDTNQQKEEHKLVPGKGGMIV